MTSSLTPTPWCCPRSARRPSATPSPRVRVRLRTAHTVPAGPCALVAGVSHHVGVLDAAWKARPPDPGSLAHPPPSTSHLFHCLAMPMSSPNGSPEGIGAPYGMRAGRGGCLPRLLPAQVAPWSVGEGAGAGLQGAEESRSQGPLSPSPWSRPALCRMPLLPPLSCCVFLRLVCLPHL